MKHVKILGLAAVAAMALMAFAASSASATALYNGTTKLGVGSELDFSLATGTKAKLTDTASNVLDECGTSTVQGKTTTAGSASETVKGTLSALTWSSCTVPTSTTKLGELEVHWTSGTTGTLTAASEIGVTVNTILFGSCVFGVKAGTNLGTLTTFSTGAATFDANATAIKLSGGAACPETSKWVATYTGTTPANLRVEAS